MKRLLMMMLGIVVMGALATPVEAKVITQEKGTITIAEDEIIDDDLYIAGETVEIMGTVNGDVYVGAGVVRFSGKTTGDLIIGSGEVYVTGEVGDDLWIGGGNAHLLNLTVGDGASIGAGSVTIDEDSTIGGSLLVGTGMLDNRATVGRNLMAGAGLVRQNSSVGGEMRVGGETIELGSKAMVAGDLTYMTEGELTLADGASIAGETKRVESKYPTQAERGKWEKDMKAMWGPMRAGFGVVGFLGALLVGLVGLWLLKKPMIAIAETIEKNFLSTLGWGLLVFVLAGPALLLLMITVVGMPLAMILGACLLVDFYLAKIFASMTAGLVLQKQFGWKKMQPVAVFAIGLALYYVLSMIPVIGMLVKLVAFLSGLGGAWMYLKSMKK